MPHVLTVSKEEADQASGEGMYSCAVAKAAVTLEEYGDFQCT
jgi:hypothetical protein